MISADQKPDGMMSPSGRTPLGDVKPPANNNAVDDLTSALKKGLSISTASKATPNVEHPSQLEAQIKAANLKEEDKEVIDWEKERDEMDKMFDKHSKEQLSDLDEFIKPKVFKKSTKFYQHQEDGTRWLLKIEKNPGDNPFMYQRELKDGTTHNYSRFTRARLATPFKPVKGAILADEMGLGKTIQTLSLIASNPAPDTSESITTIIVVPKSVIAAWKIQISEFIKKGKLEVVVYEGSKSKRSKIVKQMQTDNDIDILLVTYDTVSSEFDKKVTDNKGNPLLTIHDTSFYRCVIDEAQQIRNNKTKTYKSVMSIAEASEHRLALTGTPFVNKPDDIHSLLTFVGLEPLNDPEVFKYAISDPIKDRRRHGLSKLRTALNYVALRRTKNVLDGIDMVEKTVQVYRLEFSEGKQKEIHDCLYKVAQVALDATINASDREYTDSEEGVPAVATQAMFEILLRLRQACTHAALVPSERFRRTYEAMKQYKLDEEGTKISAHTAATLLTTLNVGSDGATNEEYDDEDLSDLSSPKIAALLDAIEHSMEADEKGVIFSQWTSNLDLVERALHRAGHRTTRIDGTMNTEDRTFAMEKLANDDSCRFILCSLRAAGVGISLTRANHVFVMDPWWNDSTENQAIDRVHRFGQTRPVKVYRYVMKDTVEERFLYIQKAKAALAKGTMKRLSKEEEKFAKLTTVKDLFQIKANDAGDFIVDDDSMWK